MRFFRGVVQAPKSDLRGSHVVITLNTKPRNTIVKSTPCVCECVPAANETLKPYMLTSWWFSTAEPVEEKQVHENLSAKSPCSSRNYYHMHDGKKVKDTKWWKS